MRLRTINIMGSAFMAKIFGDKPFEISLVRSKAIENEHANGSAAGEARQIDWLWAVQLPLDSPEFKELFESLILACVQADNDDQPATITMTATPTNIGDEVHFTFSNAFFRKCGKRKLKGAFLRANKAWTDSKDAIFWAWNNAGLPNELSKQVELLCLTAPLKVNDLQLSVRRIERCTNCHDYHIEHPLMKALNKRFAGVMSLEMISGDGLNIPGVVNIYDKDATINKSPFGKAIKKKLRLELILMLMQGMTEYLFGRQKDILRTVPRSLLDSLRNSVEMIEQLQVMGLQIEVDPAMMLLITTMEAFIDGKLAKKETNGDVAESTAIPTTNGGSNSEAGAPPN